MFLRFWKKVSGIYTIIRLKGHKKKDKEPEKSTDNIYNIRNFGDFNIEIPFKTEDYSFKNEEPKFSQMKGILIVEYTLETKENKTISGIKINEEDEI